MSDRKDGGPAFPTSTWDNEFEKVVCQTNGMTLRDYAAIKIAAAMLGTVDGFQPDGETIARLAYKQADALLSEREGSQ